MLTYQSREHNKHASEVSKNYENYQTNKKKEFCNEADFK